MSIPRLFLPLFLVLALLAAQQAGAAHAIGHALEQSQQHDQNSPHTQACEKCASYAQLGSALNVGAYEFGLISFASADVAQLAPLPQRFTTSLPVARGPPAILQKA